MESKASLKNLIPMQIIFIMIGLSLFTVYPAIFTAGLMLLSGASSNPLSSLLFFNILSFPPICFVSGLVSLIFSLLYKKFRRNYLKYIAEKIILIPFLSLAIFIPFGML